VRGIGFAKAHLMNPCEFCGGQATHFCTACGKWLCDKARCITQGAASAVKTNPVKAVVNAPAAAAHALGVLVDHFNPFKP